MNSNIHSSYFLEKYKYEYIQVYKNRKTQTQMYLGGPKKAIIHTSLVFANTNLNNRHTLVCNAGPTLLFATKDEIFIQQQLMALLYFSLTLYAGCTCK